jgi:hypothetical protein
MFYPQTTNILIHKELWTQTTMQITGGVKYQMGKYCNVMGGFGVTLALENVLSIYAKDGSLVKVYGF